MKNFKKKNLRLLSVMLALVMLFQSAYSRNGYLVAKATTDVQTQENLNEAETTSVPTATPHADDQTISSNTTLTEDMTVNELTITKGTLNLGGHQLTVLGNINLNGGNISVDGGRITCYGDCNVNNTSYISMSSQDDYVKVCGDFIVKSSNFHRITAGVLELQGNFSQLNNTTSAVFSTSGTSIMVARKIFLKSQV